MGRPRLIALAVVAALLGAAAAAVPAGAETGTAAARCVRLPYYPGLAKGLRAAHARYVRSARFKGPRPATIRYGRCGVTYFAIGYVSGPLGFADQPERFRRRVGQRWRDLGDTGGSICRFAAPETLARLWGYGRQCDDMHTRLASVRVGVGRPRSGRVAR